MGRKKKKKAGILATEGILLVKMSPLKKGFSEFSEAIKKGAIVILPELDQDLNSKRAGGSEGETRQREGATANSTKTAGTVRVKHTGIKPLTLLTGL